MNTPVQTDMLLGYEERMEQARQLANAFKATGAYKAYRSKQGIIYLVTYDPFTRERYGEPPAIRWSIYYAKRPPNAEGYVTLQHGKGVKGFYYASPERAQRALDRIAKAARWNLLLPDGTEQPAVPDEPAQILLAI